MRSPRPLVAMRGILLRGGGKREGGEGPTYKRREERGRAYRLLLGGTEGRKGEEKR